LGNLFGLHRLQLAGAFDQRAQVDIELFLDRDAQRADRGAAQTEWILGAAGLLADREDAGERVELVGERDGEPDAAAGQFATRAARHVVLVDRVRDFRRFAI